MALEEKKDEWPLGKTTRPATRNWTTTIQAISAVGVVVVAVIALIIERQIDEQKGRWQQEIQMLEEQRRKEQSQRAAIDRSIALYNFFVTSNNTKRLMEYHVQINREFGLNTDNDSEMSPKESRAAVLKAITSNIPTSRDRENVYNWLALMLNDIVPIIRCGNFKDDYWVDSQFPDKSEYETLDGDSPPLCDRETFRTILLGPVSEIFWTFRYFFYCEENFYETHASTIDRFEVMIADYTYHDEVGPGHEGEYYIFLTDRDREQVVKGQKSGSGFGDFFVLRLPLGSDHCTEFSKAYEEMKPSAASDDVVM